MSTTCGAGGTRLTDSHVTNSAPRPCATSGPPCSAPALINTSNTPRATAERANRPGPAPRVRLGAGRVSPGLGVCCSRVAENAGSLVRPQPWAGRRRPWKRPHLWGVRERERSGVMVSHAPLGGSKWRTGGVRHGASVLSLALSLSPRLCACARARETPCPAAPDRRILSSRPHHRLPRPALVPPPPPPPPPPPAADDSPLALCCVCPTDALTASCVPGARLLATAVLLGRPSCGCCGSSTRRILSPPSTWRDGPGAGVRLSSFSPCCRRPLCGCSCCSCCPSISTRSTQPTVLRFGLGCRRPLRPIPRLPSS